MDNLAKEEAKSKNFPIHLKAEYFKGVLGWPDWISFVEALKSRLRCRGLIPLKHIQVRLRVCLCPNTLPACLMTCV